MIPSHKYWEARRLCSQFKKIVPFAMDKHRGSGPREYEFPSLMSANSILQISTHLTVMYSKLTNCPIAPRPANVCGAS